MHEAERRTIVLYGDMNFPDIKWMEDSEPMNVPDDLKNFTNKWCLIQCINFPTRLNPNNTLDLLYTNDDQLVESITPNYNVTDVNQRLSDHALISIRMNVNNVKKKNWEPM